MAYSIRYATFCTWKWPQEFARRKFTSAGFMYMGYRDTVWCPDCDIELSDWPSTLDPLEEHQRQSPNCCYVRFRRHEYVEKAMKEEYTLDIIFKVYKDWNSRGLDETTFFNMLKKENGEEKKEETEGNRVENECKICLSSPADCVFLPCRHLVSCRACEKRFKYCPVCRQAIGISLKVYTC